MDYAGMIMVNKFNNMNVELMSCSSETPSATFKEVETGKLFRDDMRKYILLEDLEMTQW